MNRINDIEAKIALLQAEKATAINEERAGKLAETRATIKLYGITLKELTGVLGVQKPKKGTAKKKAPAKKVAKLEAAT